MFSRLFLRVFITGALGCLSLSVGCDTGPSSPSPLASRPSSGPLTTDPAAPLSATGVRPTRGLTIGESVRVEGTGFVIGSTVMFDGVAANTVLFVTNQGIVATAAPHAIGTVDVVVTNPGGQSATLTQGYTFDVVSLAVNSGLVRTGDQLSVNWEAPGQRSSLDWIALYKLRESNINYDDSLWQYTKGATSGTYTLRAPATGEYEFRYLLNDDYTDVARSGPITVR